MNIGTFCVQARGALNVDVYQAWILGEMVGYWVTFVNVDGEMD